MAVKFPVPPTPGRPVPRGWTLDFYNACRAAFRGDGRTIMVSTDGTISALTPASANGSGAMIPFALTVYDASTVKVGVMRGDDRYPWVEDVITIVNADQSIDVIELTTEDVVEDIDAKGWIYYEITGSKGAWAAEAKITADWPPSGDPMSIIVGYAVFIAGE